MVTSPDQSILEQLCYRPMHLSDLVEVMQIEKSSYPFPWSEGIFRDCLRVGYSSTVVEHNGKVIAYSVMSIAAEEAHILNICVSSLYCGQGIGREMMQYLIQFAADRGVQMVLLEVRPSNVVALRLYDSLGFNEIGVRKNYYPAIKGREDGIVLALAILENYQGHP